MEWASATCTLYVRKLAKTHGKPIMLFALVASNGVTIFLSIWYRRSSPVALNRGHIIQTALNMFTKLAEIILATCTCIIPAAHAHNTCTHPRRCITRSQKRVCVSSHIIHMHMWSASPLRTCTLKPVSISYFARECAIAHRLCFSEYVRIPCNYIS